MTRRTKLEVIRDMLVLLQRYKKMRITHLIYKSNLSNNSIKPYIDELKKKELISEVVEKDKRLFQITEKGIQFLSEFNKIKIFSEAYGL